jgi:DNA polymerase-3 subunit gamma/tau
MSLYQKHRPLTLDDIIGNDEIVNSLSGLIQKPDRPHVYLLHGPYGCGKTTIGRIIAAEVGALGHDFQEVNAADFRGIDTIRGIIQQACFKPMGQHKGACRAWLLDEVHAITGDAAKALLKILEDVPKHVYFILCTTDPQKLLPTIKSRCVQFQVNILNENQMSKLLNKVVTLEGESLVKEVYAQIVQDSQGHPRDALQILEQVLAVEPDERLAMAKRAAVTQSQSIELCRALIKNASWKEVSGILQGLTDQDPEGIRRLILGYCQSVLLKGDNQQAGRIMECFIEPTYNMGFPGVVLGCYSVIAGK